MKLFKHSSFNYYLNCKKISIRNENNDNASHNSEIIFYRFVKEW